jgi:hypothetical protein
MKKDKDNAEKERAESKPVVRSKETRLLKCPLTDEELLAYGQALADAQQTIVELEAELQEFKDGMKGKVAGAEGAVVRYGSLIRQRYEHRRIECEIVKDYQAETVRVIRGDTGETIESRGMEKAELEMLPM